MEMHFRVDGPEAGLKLGVFLRRRGLSLARVRALKYLPDGICVNGERARTNRVVATGDEVTLRLAEEGGFSARPEEGALDIVYESRDAMVLDKPAGLVMHPSPSHKAGTLANLFCGLMAQRGGGGVFRPVGRLDGNTSGLVLCAMNAAAAPTLAKTMCKTYLALVQGHLPPGAGEMCWPLGPAPGSAVRQCVAEDGHAAHTRYRPLAHGDGCTLVAVRLLTGRTHQIRAHFAHSGHPLLGDALYGGSPARIERHALHCAGLIFRELDGRAVCLASPLPRDILVAAEEAGVDVAALAAPAAGW